MEAAAGDASAIAMQLRAHASDRQGLKVPAKKTTAASTSAAGERHRREGEPLPARSRADQRQLDENRLGPSVIPIAQSVKRNVQLRRGATATLFGDRRRSWGEFQERGPSCWGAQGDWDLVRR
jgi:hypothetical protein